MYNAYIMETVARQRMAEAQRVADRSAGRRTNGRIVSKRRRRLAGLWPQPLRDRLA